MQLPVRGVLSFLRIGRSYSMGEGAWTTLQALRSPGWRRTRRRKKKRQIPANRGISRPRAAPRVVQGREFIGLIRKKTSHKW
jgi:hypothetical protein